MKYLYCIIVKVYLLDMMVFFSCIVLSVKLFFVDIYKIFKYIVSICISICILIEKY